MSEVTMAEGFKTMKTLRLLLPLLAGLADIIPFIYLLVASNWKSIPAFTAVICSFAPPITGFSIVIVLIYLKLKRVALDSDSVRIAIVLAIVGILEPIFYWI